MLTDAFIYVCGGDVLTLKREFKNTTVTMLEL